MFLWVFLWMFVHVRVCVCTFEVVHFPNITNEVTNTRLKGILCCLKITLSLKMRDVCKHLKKLPLFSANKCLQTNKYGMIYPSGILGEEKTSTFLKDGKTWPKQWPAQTFLVLVITVDSDSNLHDIFTTASGAHENLGVKLRFMWFTESLGAFVRVYICVCRCR